MTAFRPIADPVQKDKRRFLAALYKQDFKAAHTAFARLENHARERFPLVGETLEKHLRQIQVAFKRFVPPREVQPPLEQDQHRIRLWQDHERLQALLREMARPQPHYPMRIDHAPWKDRLDLEEWQWERIHENAITLQLTSGCSNYCRRCNEWALPRVRAHFTARALDTFLKDLNRAGNHELALYGASDPLDWEDRDRSFADVPALADPANDYSLLTKLPRGKARVLAAMVKKNIPFAVSVTHRNRERVRSMEETLGHTFTKQHDTDDLLIPAGLDEDFTTVKSSITDAYGTEITPEGVFIILPTFTSALYPMGHKKIPVTLETPFFPVRKLGRQALLVDYFKPLQVIGKQGRPFHLTTLTSLQVETLLLDSGTLEISPPGMRNLKEFFTIFDQAPGERRRRMSPSVLKRLKKNDLPRDGYTAMDLEKKALYRAKIQAHFDFCNPDRLMDFRLRAAAFFLEAVTAYCPDHPQEVEMITHLTRKEYAVLKNRFTCTLPQALVEETEADFFDRFRYHVLALIRGEHIKGVADFILEYTARYDAVSDRFVPVSPPDPSP